MVDSRSFAVHTMTLRPPLSPGRIVRVRSRQYLVEGVASPATPADQTLVHLSCIDDDAQGASLSVLWEREPDAEVLDGDSWRTVAARGFDDPRRFSAYLHTLRWNCVTSTVPNLLQAPYRAGIQVLAYQLEPLRKALQLPRVNLFIADDVGLGKTIEAGLILREMLVRQKVRRVVVCCPPSVLLQWRDELEQRFGLTFQIYDRAYVAAMRRERGWGVNPWDTHTRFLLSHSLLRDETYAGPLRAWLGDFCPASLLILDEAHHAAPASSARYAIDSHLTRVVRDVAPRFEHRLFLSATPHNGHSNSFSALLEILDPQRFCRGVPVKAAQHDAILVRRLKSDLREIGQEFPVRRILPEKIDGLPESAPELRLSRLLDEYAALRESRFADATRSARNAAQLVLISLQKRLLSSIEAFACTLEVHRRAIERQAAEAAAPARVLPDFRRLDLLAAAPAADDERADFPEADVAAEEHAQVEAVTRALESGPKRPQRRERELLAEMAAVAARARGAPDPRVDRILDWIRAELCPRGRWNRRRVILFTEYADTKRWLDQQLRGALADTERGDERVLTYHGGMDEARREEVKQAFLADPDRHPVRVLIATDAAREGVNLQAHCADLFHFDIPWNPSRLEQRNGRIDRKLQPEPEVRCRYFVFVQRAEDPVLDTLVRKTERVAEELGSLTPVIDRRLSDLLSGGIRHGAVPELAAAIERERASDARRPAVDEELEAGRARQAQLRKQLAALQGMLEKSKDALGLDEERFRDAVSCSLELLGAAPLRPAGDGAGWLFPALDRRAGADPTWAETLDTLRPPRRRDQKPWDWRREAGLRPLVFADPGRLDAGVVHLHLEHRVTRRLLDRLLAQGFVHDDLSRACVAPCADPVPRVLLLGRLSLYGPHAARLHEEIVAIAARHQDAAGRKRGLEPLGAQAEAKALHVLAEGLAHAGSRTLPQAIRERLLQGVERDVTDLLPHLKVRAEALAEEAKKKLAVRGDQEARAMTKLLEEQRARIEKELAKRGQTQLEFDFTADERRQRDAERRHWKTRLTALAEEHRTEPERIRAVYEVRAQRVEPVGVVYLWPVSG